jgi:hypothetical protein
MLSFADANTLSDLAAGVRPYDSTKVDGAECTRAWYARVSVVLGDVIMVAAVGLPCLAILGVLVAVICALCYCMAAGLRLRKSTRALVDWCQGRT